MKIYKGKSFYPHIMSDEEIEKSKPSIISCISFEEAITLFRRSRNQMALSYQPIGYKVTENGIELIFE